MNNISDASVVTITRQRFYMSFGTWLRSARLEKGYTLRELARRSNGACTHGYISQLESNTGGKKGAYRPDVEIVDALATALDKNINEARLAAGYAPMNALRKPTTIPELIEALEALGIEAPQLYGGFPKDDDGEGFREIVERIWLDIGMVLSRLEKGRGPRVPQPLQLNEREDTLETEPRPLSKIG